VALSVSWLLDVNFILASRWTTHPEHRGAKAWLDTVGGFQTCSISELGFVRISLSSAYGAIWEDVQESLKQLHVRKGYQFLADDVNGTDSPQTSSKDTTDAHLVALAKRHGLKLATLDGILAAKPWAAGVAENPLRRALKSS
jgi:predicted nucleic acid-binding protein